MGRDPGRQSESERIRTITSKPVTSMREAAAQIQALAEHAAQMADELVELRRRTGEEHVSLKARLRTAGQRIEDLERAIGLPTGEAQRAGQARKKGKKPRPPKPD